jgi:hypothetical protein
MLRGNSNHGARRATDIPLSAKRFNLRAMKPDFLPARRESLRELRTIPGIGPSLALDLYSLGIRRVADLKAQDPEKLYRRLERLTAAKQDRCVLYTFRCAVYFAETKNPRPDRLLWWNWKDFPAQTPKHRPRSPARRARS